MYPNIKKVGLLYYPAYPYPFGTEVTAALAPLGITVNPLQLTVDQTDFTPQATKGIADGDQGYIDESYPVGHISFAEALYNRGITQGTELFAEARLMTDHCSLLAKDIWKTATFVKPRTSLIHLLILSI